MADIRFSFRACGAVRLHVAESGPTSGPLVILLHGFPEYWFGWRHQIGALAHAGFHVIAPDQRGYNLSDKPRGVVAYDLDVLAGDIIALADVYGASTFGLVGHDWGASVAWWIAEHHPGRLSHAVTINAPHPAIWRNAIDSDPEQRKLSRYVKIFAVPFLPELLMRSGNYSALEGALRESVRPPCDDEVAQYRTAWSRDGVLTAMINYYRALLRRWFEMPREGSIMAPIHIIWGAKDKYGLPRLAEQSRDICRSGSLTLLPDATHWAQHDEPARVNEILLNVLNG
jgi:pimeloyl-ACP methyl ester carboxylesterase